MEFLGYIFLAVMGLTLSLIGAGGSILTIPILTYFLSIPIIKATSFSIIIVGSTALIASVKNKKDIQFNKIVSFTISSVIGVFISRHYIISNLPESIGYLYLSTDKLLIILLLILMALGGYFMI